MRNGPHGDFVTMINLRRLTYDNICRPGKAVHGQSNIHDMRSSHAVNHLLRRPPAVCACRPDGSRTANPTPFPSAQAVEQHARAAWRRAALPRGYNGVP